MAADSRGVWLPLPLRLLLLPPPYRLRQRPLGILRSMSEGDNRTHMPAGDNRIHMSSDLELLRCLQGL